MSEGRASTINRITTKALLRSLPATKLDTILVLLRSRPLVHKSELIDALWGDDEDGGPDDAEHTLALHIWKLRHWHGHEIVTRHTRGYELQAQFRAGD